MAENSERLRLLVETGAHNFCIFGKTDRDHAELVIGDVEENVLMIKESVAFLKAQVAKHDGGVIFDAEHFFDGYLKDPKYSVRCIRAAIDGGADYVVFCDTNGGIESDTAAEIFASLTNPFGIMQDQAWGVHMHDDAGEALVSSKQAVKYGATMVQCTFNGEAERVSMVSIRLILPALVVKPRFRKLNGVQVLGFESDDSLTDLKQYADEIALKQNTVVQPNTPYVDSHAFTHKASAHIYGARKKPELQEHINPLLVGNERVYPYSSQVGQNEIHKKLKEYGVTLNSSQFKAFRECLTYLDAQGFMLEDAQETFVLRAQEFKTGYVPAFELRDIKFEVYLSQVASQNNMQWFDQFNHRSEVYVWMSDVEDQQLTGLSGEGPLDAATKAIKRGLKVRYDSNRIDAIKLEGFRVRNIDRGNGGTNDAVRVRIVHSVGQRLIHTAGVSQNILEAMKMALVDAYLYVLNDQELYSSQKESSNS